MWAMISVLPLIIFCGVLRYCEWSLIVDREWVINQQALCFKAQDICRMRQF